MTEVDEAPLERPGALAAIGQTPVVRLSKLPGPESADVWVKLEDANPTGSYKDRMALAMIKGAERRGTLTPGQTVVDYTGGSTGSSLATASMTSDRPGSSTAGTLPTIPLHGRNLDCAPNSAKGAFAPSRLDGRL